MLLEVMVGTLLCAFDQGQLLAGEEGAAECSADAGIYCRGVLGGSWLVPRAEVD